MIKPFSEFIDRYFMEIVLLAGDFGKLRIGQAG
jgi:hypothetical protein